MKERYDLSLDNRQIVSLLISSLVVLGAVFVLGVVVGKKLAGNQKAAQAPDLLTALDQKATQLEQVQKEPQLTFQDALAAKTPEPAAPKEVAKPAADLKPAVKTEPKTEAVAANTTEPAVARVAAEKPVAKVAAAKPVKGTSELDAAFAKASARPGAKGAFALQVAASQDRKEAERQVARLKERGYAPYIVTGELPGKGTWFRVRVGHFQTRDEAARYREDFTRETHQDAFVAAD